MAKQINISHVETGISSGVALSRGTGLVLHTGLTSGAGLSGGDHAGFAKSGVGSLTVNMIQHGLQSVTIFSGAGSQSSIFNQRFVTNPATFPGTAALNTAPDLLVSDVGGVVLTDNAGTSLTNDHSVW